MGLRKKARLIIYRFRERGLEVFLTQHADRWDLPEGELRSTDNPAAIALEPAADCEEAIAVEGDWHEIPSLKQMLYEDAGELTERLKDLESGTFLTIKDALKNRLSPGQVQFLRELVEVVTDRNSVRDI